MATTITMLLRETEVSNTANVQAFHSIFQHFSGLSAT